jgi:hypothetical protein
MRLVDADKLKISYDGHFVGVAKNDLDNAPTVEAEPIIHAHWERDVTFDGFKVWKCSNCACRFNYISTEWGLSPVTYAYGIRCGHCGAVMDK